MEEQINKKELQVLIIHPERIIFEGKAKAITSVNETGQFDILPMHSNFVSILKEKVVVHLMDGTEKMIPIEEAILKVYINKVWIFVGVKESIAENKSQFNPI